MAFLVVEDGTGLINANAYANVATADDYHATRNNIGWFSDGDRAAMLIRGTQFLEAKYRARWPGIKLKQGPNGYTTFRQSLSWPRWNARDIDGYPIMANIVPIEVIWANCEAALRELVIQQQQAVQVAQASTGTTVASSDQLLKRKTAGDTTFEYYNVPTTATVSTAASTNIFTASPAATYGVEDVISGILAPLLLSDNKLFGVRDRIS